MRLPSERTLRDYTNLFEQKVGYQPEVMSQLLEDINSLGDEQKYVSVLIDVKEKFTISSPEM